MVNLYIDTEITIGSYYICYYLVAFVVLALLSAGLYLFRRRMSPLLRGGVILVMLVALVRIALFVNPYTWSYYRDMLGREKYNIGTRQRDLIKHEARLFSRELYPAKLPYLVVGSSQTDFLFSDYAYSHDDFGLFHLAALGPVDLVLNRKEIKSMNPETVILYLSEFDMGRLWWERYYLAPGQGLSVFGLYKFFKGTPFVDHFPGVARDLIVGELFPEIKYSYIFKSLLKKKLKRNDAEKEMERRREKVQKVKGRKNVILRGQPMEEVKFNYTFLEEFIKFAALEGIDIIILQGSYNHDYFKEEYIPVKLMATELFVELGEKYEHVTFIGEDELYRFEPGDYNDFLHVKKEPAERFREYLFKEHLRI